MYSNDSLSSIVQNAVTLTTQLQTAITAIYKSPSLISNDAPATNQIDPLALLRDASSLIRAHSTKLSLLIINEPFTPSAISTVIRELVAQPIPALATAVQTCDPATYTALFRKEVAWRTQRLLAELGELFKKIPTDGKVLSGDKKSSFAAGGQKGSLAATGVLWSTCEDVTKIANLGVAGFFVFKVEQWKDTLKDVMEELKEWGDEEPDDDDDDDDDFDDGVTHSDNKDGDPSTQDMLDELMNSGQTIPKDDPHSIRPRLESSLRRIRLVILLYQAISKRRLKRLPTIPNKDKDPKEANIPARLDELSVVLQKLPSQFSDLALAFYELDPKPIDGAMDQCFLDAFAASELLVEAWRGGRDEYTDWAEKFQLEIKKS